MGGAIIGPLAVFLVFVPEGSTSRDIPTWGIVLMIIAIFIGGAVGSIDYFRFEHEDESEDKKN